MLSSWTVKNFKSIANKTKLEFAPLTIFAGANSSGKSTIIQSILMVTQTIQNSVSTKSIVLNGHIIKLGIFSDILSNNSTGDDISIEFKITPEKDEKEDLEYGFFDVDQQIKELSCEFSFSSKAEGKQEILQLQPQLLESRMKVVYLNDSEDEDQDDYELEVHIVKSKEEQSLKLTRYQLDKSKMSQSELTALNYDVVSPKKSNKYGNFTRRPRIGDFIGATLHHFLPSNLVLRYDRVEEENSTALEVLLNPRYLDERIGRGQKIWSNEEIKSFVVAAIDEIIDENPTPPDQNRFEAFYKAKSNLREEFSLLNLKKCYVGPMYSSLLTQKFDQKKEELRELISKNKDPEYAIDVQNYSDERQFVESFFKQKIEYLGPLRDEPKPVYPLQGSADPKDIGFKGENTAAVLDIHKDMEVEYIKPENVSAKSHERVITRGPLLNAVLDWLSYMGIADNVKTADQGKLGHGMQIIFDGSSHFHDLTHVGVGVSQVLPILVLSLLAERDATLIFEQPELHLNPRVQTRLGDFFASMVFVNKQCIVETHSEYLINRLRYLVATSDGEELSSKINMYFVEKEDNKSIYNSVKINQYGTITEWPKGFFDENESNASAILQAAMEKKSKYKSKAKN